MTTAADILTKAGIQLVDPDAVRWTFPELVAWLNAAIRAIIIAKPSASSKAFVLPLVEGTRQGLPDDHDPEILALLSIGRNVASAAPGAAAGRAIRPTTRDLLDVSEPYWHDPRTVRFRKEVKQYTFDENVPRAFFVYPGNDGTGFVEAECSYAPTEVAAVGPDDAITSYASEIPLQSIWEEVILDYVLFRALSRDDLDGNAGRAMMHMQAFAAATGQKIATEAASSANARRGVTSQ